MAELPATFPEPLRVLRAAHRGAARYSKRAYGEVSTAAAGLIAYAEADGIDLGAPATRQALAWVLCAVGAAPDRDHALAIVVEAVAVQLDQEADRG